MIQSFVSVNPIERRSALSKEFVLIGDGGHLIIAVLESSSRRVIELVFGVRHTLYVPCVALCAQGPAGPLPGRPFASCPGAGRNRPSPLPMG